MTDNDALSRAILLMRVACYLFFAFAAAWWLAALPAMDWSARMLIDISDWPIDPTGFMFEREGRFLSAIGAGLLAGLTGLLLFVVVPELERGNARVVRGAVIGVLLWYGVDSLGCAILGIWSNVILNTIYLSVILPPLLLAGRACLERQPLSGNGCPK